MKALLIDPQAQCRITTVNIEDDPTAWRTLISPDCAQLGHLTLAAGGTGVVSSRKKGLSGEVVAVFDDQGELAEGMGFSVFSKAHGQWMTLYGRSLVFVSDEREIGDANRDDMIKRLSLVFESPFL